MKTMLSEVDALTEELASATADGRRHLVFVYGTLKRGFANYDRVMGPMHAHFRGPLFAKSAKNGECELLPEAFAVSPAANAEPEARAARAHDPFLQLGTRVPFGEEAPIPAETSATEAERTRLIVDDFGIPFLIVPRTQMPSSAATKPEPGVTGTAGVTMTNNVQAARIGIGGTSSLEETGTGTSLEEAAPEAPAAAPTLTAIGGEVYAVDDVMLKQLDALEGYRSERVEGSSPEHPLRDCAPDDASDAQNWYSRSRRLVRLPLLPGSSGSSCPSGGGISSGRLSSSGCFVVECHVYHLWLDRFLKGYVAGAPAPGSAASETSASAMEFLDARAVPSYTLHIHQREYVGKGDRDRGSRAVADANGQAQGEGEGELEIRQQPWGGYIVSRETGA